MIAISFNKQPICKQEQIADEYNRALFAIKLLYGDNNVVEQLVLSHYYLAMRNIPDTEDSRVALLNLAGDRWKFVERERNKMIQKIKEWRLECE